MSPLTKCDLLKTGLVGATLALSQTSFVASVLAAPASSTLRGPQTGQAFTSGAASREVQTAFSKVSSDSRQTLTPEETKVLVSLGGKLDTSKARYVWLPITFENDRPIIRWRDEWTIEDFA